MVDGQSGIYRWIDYARSYNIHQNLVVCVWKHAIACHQSQRKAYMSQMHNYRKKGWDNDFSLADKQNIIMHDNTDIWLLKPLIKSYNRYWINKIVLIMLSLSTYLYQENILSSNILVKFGQTVYEIFENLLRIFNCCYKILDTFWLNSIYKVKACHPCLIYFTW